MPNPQEHYEHEKDPTVYEIGRGVSWAVALLFMLMLWLPPLSEHLHDALTGKWSETPAARLFHWQPAQGSLVNHLHSVERNLDRSDYSTFIRQSVQGWLTGTDGEGTSKVFIGYDGWLFYQPDITALTGYGPLQPEPFSVMKDPELAKLPNTKDVVIGFASQLKERGISLLLVPVPLKPMVYSEYITGSANYSWVTHPDAGAFYELLRSKGVDVLDLTADIAQLRNQRKYIFRREPAKRDREVDAAEDERLKKTKDAFLMQDTHWTPDAMRLAAEKVVAHVKKNYAPALQSGLDTIRAVDGETRSSLGDLVKLLDVRHPKELFEPESVFLRMMGQGTQSKDSTVVLLGDSFVNVYDDPTLGFADPAKPTERIRAGFAQHLSLLLGQPLDVIAMNGQGATGVRKQFAIRHDDEVRTKKLVIWVIAARDLLLSKTAAHAANIDWAPVVFNPKRTTAPPTPVPGELPSAGQDVVIEARLVEKTKNQTLDSPYRNALHTALYDVEKVISGKLESKQVVGVEWTFQEKKMAPTASFVVGQRYRLTLVPWDKRPELHGLNLADDTTALDADRWFVTQAEPLP